MWRATREGRPPREATQRQQTTHTGPTGRGPPWTPRGRSDDHRAGRAKGKGGEAVYIPLLCRARAACEEADEHRFGWEQGQGERRAAVMLGYNPNWPLPGPRRAAAPQRAEASGGDPQGLQNKYDAAP